MNDYEFIGRIDILRQNHAKIFNSINEFGIIIKGMQSSLITLRTEMHDLIISSRDLLKNLKEVSDGVKYSKLSVIEKIIEKEKYVYIIPPKTDFAKENEGLYVFLSSPHNLKKLQEHRYIRDNKRNLNIFLNRMGLLIGECKTIKELSNESGISVARVRQVADKTRRAAESVMRKEKENVTEIEKEESDVEKKELEHKLNQSIHVLKLTARSTNCLISDNINIIGDLIERTEVDLLKIPNMGKLSLREVIVQLKEKGLELKRWQPNG